MVNTGITHSASERTDKSIAIESMLEFAIESLLKVNSGNWVTDQRRRFLQLSNSNDQINEWANDR